MQTQPVIDRCLHVIGSQAQRMTAPTSSDTGAVHRLAITISRQTGSGAHCVAASLAGYLQARNGPESSAWTVFDRDLVERVLKDHNLPGRLARFMPEDRVPDITDTLDELLGFHPPSYMLVQQTAETILHLANEGNVILIGRGAHVITSGLDHVFHVRLVGSLERRIAHIQELHRVGKKEALELIRREDRGRHRYLKKYFSKDIDDPLSYHLVVNTDAGPYERAARLIGEAALNYVHTRQGPAEENFRAREGLAMDLLVPWSRAIGSG